MRETKRYACKYFHDGTWWALSIDAYDYEDASLRAKRLGLQLEGLIVLETQSKTRLYANLWLRKIMDWLR